MTRLYVPTTPPALAAYLRDGAVDGLAEGVVADEETEEGEYAALMTAADASAELVAGLPDGVRRRVVVVVETPATQGPVPLREVAAVHLDVEDDVDPDDDLGWYALSELVPADPS